MYVKFLKQMWWVICLTSSLLIAADFSFHCVKIQWIHAFYEMILIQYITCISNKIQIKEVSEHCHWAFEVIIKWSFVAVHMIIRYNMSLKENVKYTPLRSYTQSNAILRGYFLNFSNDSIVPIYICNIFVYISIVDVPVFWDGL